MLIDDDLPCINSLKDALVPGGYKCSVFQNPQEGISAFKKQDFDIVITDFKMPEMNGIEVLKEIRKYNPYAYVIMLTGYADIENAIESVNNGAYAFFRKPLNFKELMDTISKITYELSHLKEINWKIQEIRESIFKNPLSIETPENKNIHPFNKMLDNNITPFLEEIQSFFNKYFINNVEFFAKAVEARDIYTSGHVGRVAAYTLAIATKLGWNHKKLEQAYLGSLLHDVGKIGIPDTILNKPGFLTDEEFEIVKTHVVIGVNMLKGLPQFDEIINYVRSHHERFDGLGYPGGLKGKEIPIEGRIICIADSYDAMTTERPYRKALFMKDAVVELKKCSGIQFDPEIVEVFLSTLQSGSFSVEYEKTGRRKYVKT